MKVELWKGDEPLEEVLREVGRRLMPDFGGTHHQLMLDAANEIVRLKKELAAANEVIRQLRNSSQEKRYGVEAQIQKTEAG